MSRILLGVSGGIAAYKALELVRLATKAGHAVRVVQTPASEQFVGRASFAALTGAPVLLDEFERDPLRGVFPGDPAPAHDPISHLALVENADVFMIAPASANTLAKLAGGHADNLLTSAALAATCPVIVAPAMNNHMWAHPATRANLDTLRARGVSVVDPGVGQLASKGEYGAGRLAEPDVFAFHRHQFTGVRRRQCFDSIYNPFLSAAHCFAVREAGARRVFLHYMPHFTGCEFGNFLPLPIAISHLANSVLRQDFQVRMVLPDGLSRFHRPLQRAGIQPLDGSVRQPLAQRLGLGFAFVIQVDAWRPTSQFARFDEIVYGVSN